MEHLQLDLVLLVMLTPMQRFEHLSSAWPSRSRDCLPQALVTLKHTVRIEDTGSVPVVLDSPVVGVGQVGFGTVQVTTQQGGVLHLVALPLRLGQQLHARYLWLARSASKGVVSNLVGCSRQAGARVHLEASACSVEAAIRLRTSGGLAPSLCR